MGRVIKSRERKHVLRLSGILMACQTSVSVDNVVQCADDTTHPWQNTR